MPVIAGTQRWIKLGAISFQPSEIGKLLLVIALAKFIADNQGKLNDRTKAIYQGGEYREDKKLEQVHFLLGFRGLKYFDKDFVVFSGFFDKVIDVAIHTESTPVSIVLLIFR